MIRVVLDGELDHIAQTLDGKAECGVNPWPGVWESATGKGQLCAGCAHAYRKRKESAGWPSSGTSTTPK